MYELNQSPDSHHMLSDFNVQNLNENVRQITSSITDTVEMQSPRTTISYDRLFIDYAEPIAAKVIKKRNGMPVPFHSISKSEEKSLKNSHVTLSPKNGFHSSAMESSVIQSISLEESSELPRDESYVAPFGKIFRLSKKSSSFTSRQHKTIHTATIHGRLEGKKIRNINTGNRYSHLMHVNCKSETQATFTFPPSFHVQEVRFSQTKYLNPILVVPEMCIVISLEFVVTLTVSQFTTVECLSEVVSISKIATICQKMLNLCCEANGIKPSLKDTAYFKINYSSEFDKLDFSPNIQEPLMGGDVAHDQHESPLSKPLRYSPILPTITTSELITELIAISDHKFSLFSEVTNIFILSEPEFVTCILSESRGPRNVAYFYHAHEDNRHCCLQSLAPTNISCFTSAVHEKNNFLNNLTINISGSEERKYLLNAYVGHEPLVPLLLNEEHKLNAIVSSVTATIHVVDIISVEKTTMVYKHEANELLTTIQYLKVNGHTFDSIHTIRWIKARSNISRERHGNDNIVVNQNPVQYIEHAISVRNTNLCFAEEVNTYPANYTQLININMTQSGSVWLNWLQQSSVVAFSGLAIKMSIYGMKTSDFIPISGVGVALAICALICYRNSR